MNPKLFDQDSPTFHVHKSRIGELIRKFKDAQEMVNSKNDENCMDMPEKLTRLKSRIENDSMLEDDFKRLSEKEKIFCAKQVNSFI